MNKKYLSPEIEIIEISFENIITTSTSSSYDTGEWQEVNMPKGDFE